MRIFSGEVLGVAFSILKTTSFLISYIQNYELLGIVNKSFTGVVRLGSVITISSMSSRNPTLICQSQIFQSFVKCLHIVLDDDKFLIREAPSRHWEGF